MTLIKRIQVEENKTIILVSHDMNDVSRYADEVIVLSNGKVAEQSEPRELFKNTDKLAEWHITLPNIIRLQIDFEHKYQISLPKLALNEEEFIEMYMSGKMKNKLIIGRYLPNHSTVHHLDPRAKLIFVFVFIIFIFFLSFVWHIRLDIFTYHYIYEIG